MLTSEELNTLASVWLVVAPFVTLLMIYSWDYGMDLIVPMSRYQIMRRALTDIYAERE